MGGGWRRDSVTHYAEGMRTHPAQLVAMIPLWVIVVSLEFCVLLWPLIPMTTRAMLGSKRR